MKKEYIAIALIIIAIVLGIIFYFNTREVVDTNTLEYTAGCSSEKIDSSVYTLKGDTSRIGAFVSFNEIPISQTVRDRLTDMDIFLREESWVLDYTLAEIPTESLCDLAKEDFVKYVFLPNEIK